MAEITLIAAFMAGLASFASPCFLPLIPAFMSYIGGTSINKNVPGSHSREKTIYNTISFVLGFVIVFSILGVALNSVLSAASPELLWVFGRIAGVLVIIFGLVVLGVVRIGALEREYRITPAKTRYAYLTSFILGAAFAVSWTPCVGVMLASILALAAVQPGNSFVLMFLYSLGLAVPFILTGAFTAQANDLIRKHEKEMPLFNRLMGLSLVIIGILIITGDFARLALGDSQCAGS